MYIYNYLHIWRAARNVKNPPANNYGCKIVIVICLGSNHPIDSAFKVGLEFAAAVVCQDGIRPCLILT